MKKEDLIIKWLDQGLEEKELQAFKKLDAYSTFKSIDEGIQGFKAPAFDKAGVFAKIQAEKAMTSEPMPWKRIVAGIAAMIVLSLGVYFSYFQTDETTFFAQNQEHSIHNLPDRSQVTLNAGSMISYDGNQWDSDRKLHLEGEAFFDVEKGSKFRVQTSHGSVTVLGTEFNVKSRPDYFEVRCYEGLVEVQFQNNRIQLPAGKGYRVFQNKVEASEVTGTRPDWINYRSTFNQVPFSEIVAELERQYNVQVAYDSDLSQVLLTTNFTHKNLDAALQAITIPLKLSYDFDGSNVMLNKISSE